jgi:hypothetical protein
MARAIESSTPVCPPAVKPGTEDQPVDEEVDGCRPDHPPGQAGGLAGIGALFHAPGQGPHPEHVRDPGGEPDDRDQTALTHREPAPRTRPRPATSSAKAADFPAREAGRDISPTP